MIIDIRAYKENQARKSANRQLEIAILEDKVTRMLRSLNDLPDFDRDEDIRDFIFNLVKALTYKLKELKDLSK